MGIVTEKPIAAKLPGRIGTLSVEIEFDQALKNANRRSARWPTRDRSNRLEPECWPETRPSFTLARGCKVFTIGSCFARHIETHLDAHGFEVPAVTFAAEYDAKFGINLGEMLNKYTPASIWQELSWTRGILERDGVITPKDIEPFLLDLGDDDVLDMHRLQLGTQTRAEALEKRQIIFDLFRQAFECDICIITLGLIEAWYDRETEQFIEFSPLLKKSANIGRFSCRALGFEECYRYTKDVVEILSSNRSCKILMTTSPIPILRTFTTQDAIVANTHSKSVLRAVCGEIVDVFPNVDYFPSFEIVQLTKEPHIWDDDLAHVNPAFIGRIMQKVIDSYVDLSQKERDEAILTDKLLRIINLMSRNEYAEARKVYGTDELERVSGGRGDLALARMFVETGEIEFARIYADAARSYLEQPGSNREIEMFMLGRVFQRIGEPEKASPLMETAIEVFRGRPHTVWSLLRGLQAAGDDSSINHIVMVFGDEKNETMRLLIARFFCGRAVDAVHHSQLVTARAHAAVAIEFAPKEEHIKAVNSALATDELPHWLLKAADRQQ